MTHVKRRCPYGVGRLASGVDAHRVEFLLLQGEESIDGYPLLALRLAGGARVMLYSKPNHAPASYTVLNFEVPDIDRAVTELEGRGVRFEHYSSGPVKTDARGISRTGTHAIAWFKDPAGNTLSVVQQR